MVLLRSRHWGRGRGPGVRQRLLRSQSLMYRRQRLARRALLALLIIRRAAGLWGREQAPERAGKCVGGRRLVIAVGRRRAGKRVQRADHGGRMFSLILHLFPLDLVGVQVVYRRQANAASQLAGPQHQTRRNTARARGQTRTCACWRDPVSPWRREPLAGTRVLRGVRGKGEQLRRCDRGSRRLMCQPVGGTPDC